MEKNLKNQRILHARNIEKSFGDKHIISNISFDIGHGDCIGLVGYNGTGKTTLANLILGKVKPEKGVMEWHNDNVEISYLEQSIDFSLNSLHTSIPGALTSEYFEITSELGLQKVGSWQEERFEHLSGGEKLKLALANIWQAHPEILILDDPPII
jgi:macrolide transport system ATP-binding/permease protein